MTRCAVNGCNNNGHHGFPKDPYIRNLWVKAARIQNVNLGTAKLCSQHFSASDYQGKSTATGQRQCHMYLKKNTVPTIFPWNSTVSVSEKKISLKRSHSSHRELFPVKPNQLIIPNEDHIDFVPLNKLESDYITLDKPESPKPESEQFKIQTKQPEPELVQPNLLQPESNLAQIESGSVHLQSTVSSQTSQTFLGSVPVHSQNTVSTQTSHISRLLSHDDLLSDSKSVLFYTGLENIEKFNLAFESLLPMANHLIYRGSQVLNISTEDQFLLMLIKLRRNKEDFELGKIFSISTTEVGNIFVTWVNFVYELWSHIDIWPKRDLVNYYMPKTFKQHHPSTRIIVDGTEIPIIKPKNPKSQQATFSSYKHRNTVKFLVGATPGGLLCYCSEGYGGATSDRQITERSSLLNLCEENDSIMADRGFNVQDLFESKNISVNIPTFLKGLTQLPGIKLKHDRKLASNRIHIERLIGLSKTYKILKSEVNTYYVPLLSRIFFICIMLCNFKEGIVK